MSEIGDFLRARYLDRRDEADLIHAIGCGSIRYDGPCDCGMPQEVIADLDAKLWIVNAAEKLPELTAAFDQFDNNRDAWARTLRHLTQQFAGHPDHKGEEWAP